MAEAEEVTRCTFTSRTPADHAPTDREYCHVRPKEFLRQDVQHNAIFRKRNISGCVYCVVHIVAVNVPRPVPQGDASAAVHSADVAARHACNDAFDRHSGDAFRFFDRAPHRSCRRADVGNQSLAQAFGFRRAHGHKFCARLSYFADDGTGLGAPDVQRD